MVLSFLRKLAQLSRDRSRCSGQHEIDNRHSNVARRHETSVRDDSSAIKSLKDKVKAVSQRMVPYPARPRARTSTVTTKPLAVITPVISEVQEHPAVEAADDILFWDAPDAEELSLEADDGVVADVYTDTAAQTGQHLPQQHVAIHSTFPLMLMVFVLSWTSCMLQLTAFPWVCKLALAVINVAAMAAGIQLYAPFMWLKLLANAGIVLSVAHRLLTVAGLLLARTVCIVRPVTHQGYCLGASWVVKQAVEIQHGAKAIFGQFLSLLHNIARGIQWTGQLRKRSMSAVAAKVSRFTLPSFSIAPSLASIVADFCAHSSCVAFTLWVATAALVPEWIFDYILKLLLPSLVVVGGVTLYIVLLNWADLSAISVPSLAQQVKDIEPAQGGGPLVTVKAMWGRCLQQANRFWAHLSHHFGSKASRPQEAHSKIDILQQEMASLKKHMSESGSTAESQMVKVEKELRDTRQQMSALQQSMTEANTAHAHALQEHVRQCQLEHQQLANAAQQDRAAGHSQIAKLTSNLETAEQRVAALQQSLTDASTAHAQALQEHAKQVSAAQQDRTTAQSQMSRLDRDLQEAVQQVAALKQALADSDTAYADALQEHGRQQELKQEHLVITTEQARADAQSQMNQQLQEAQQQLATLQQSLADSNTAHAQSLQEHARQVQQEHQKLATASEHDRAAAQTQIMRLTSDLDAANQWVATLEQRVADSENGHAHASQVCENKVVEKEEEGMAKEEMGIDTEMQRNDTEVMGYAEEMMGNNEAESTIDGKAQEGQLLLPVSSSRDQAAKTQLKSGGADSWSALSRPETRPRADNLLLEHDERIGAFPQGRGLLQIRDVTIYPGWEGSLLAGQHEEDEKSEVLPAGPSRVSSALLSLADFPQPRSPTAAEAALQDIIGMESLPDLPEEQPAGSNAVGSDSGAESIAAVQAAPEAGDAWLDDFDEDLAAVIRDARAPSAEMCTTTDSQQKGQEVEATERNTGTFDVVGDVLVDRCRPALQQYEIEAQDAFAYFVKKTQMNIAQDSPMPMETWELASEDYEVQAYKHVQKYSGQHKTDSWLWVQAPFHSAVRVLKAVDRVPDLGLLGQGVGAKVYYCEVAMRDGGVFAAALKDICYDSATEQLRANAELAALRDAEGCQLLGQCLGVITYQDARDNKQHLAMLLEYAEGLSLSDAKKQLYEEAQQQPDFLAAYIPAIRSLMAYLVEAAAWFHAQGRAHCDIKVCNVRIKLSPNQDATIVGLKLIDFGGSVKHSGLISKVPKNFTFTYFAASPAIVRAAADGVDEHIDACALDVWSLGSLLVELFACVSPWAGPASANLAELKLAHEKWADEYTADDKCLRQQHFIIAALDSGSSADETGQLFQLACSMLHPQDEFRATLDEVVQSGFFDPVQQMPSSM